MRDDNEGQYEVAVGEKMACLEVWLIGSSQQLDNREYKLGL